MKSEHKIVEWHPKQMVRGVLPLLLTMAALYVLLKLLWVVVDYILLLFAASLIALCVHRLARLLECKIGLPEKVGVVSLLILAIAGLVGGAYLMGSFVVEQFQLLAEQVPNAWSQLRGRFGDDGWLERVFTTLEEGPEEFPLTGVFGSLGGAFSSAAAFLKALLFFLAIAFFLCLQPRLYLEGFVRLLKRPARQKRAREVLNALGELLWLFLLGQMVTMTTVGTCVTLGLWFLGVPSFLALGLMAGALGFIPVVGPFLAFLPALMVAFADPGVSVIAVCLLYGVIETLESSFLTPMVQKKMVEAPPVLLLTGQAIMSLLFGILGIVLAAPTVVALMVLVEELHLKEREEVSTPVEVVEVTSRADQVGVRSELLRDPIP